ncbi:peptidylprolyl isomerase [Moorena producens JHB]|uniref:peptidylprolyl isomerase n=1 Tax=Moorena producens (strain JHB) TaxID=1454205 RepID=A0A1D9FU61_MOOP1|nr:peptidylprolyl isomerase [Moorena producens]AOY78891.1 peptidylprolyl isomerase [Moorena producens JHB]
MVNSQKKITITKEDIWHQVKLSGNIPDLVEEIVTRKVVKDAVDEAGINIEVEELQKVADQMRLMNNLSSADETWAWLEQRGMSLDDFEEVVYDTVSSGKLSAHLFADKVESYFYENQLDYAGVVMYEVVLDDQDLALELFYEIQEGDVSFYDVAHDYSQEQELRRKLGYRGIMYRKDLKPEISAAVFAANPPEVLKPIVTAQGVHLLLVEEIVQGELDEQLRYQIMSDLFSGWLKQQIDKIEVVKNLELSTTKLE